MSNGDSIGPDRETLAAQSMRRLAEAGKHGGRGLLDHLILAGSPFAELLERVKNGEGEDIRVLNIGAGDKAVMERELANARGEIGQEPYFIIDSPTFSKEANKEAVLQALRADNVERAVTIDDFAHNLESVPDGFCDYVFAVNLFQHLPTQDMPNALQEIVRVLKPGGKAVIVPLYEPKAPEVDVPGNRTTRGASGFDISSAERFLFPQLDLLRGDLSMLPGSVGFSVKIREEEIPFNAFMAAQGGDPDRVPSYMPYTVIIEKLVPEGA